VAPAVARPCQSLPVVSPARRAAIRALPATRETHERLAPELAFLERVEVAEPTRPAALPETVRVVAWNAERCKALAASARWLAAAAPDVLLLTEMDLGMARSDQLHTTRELARILGCGYAFAAEFLELDLGGAAEREDIQSRTPRAENEIGYHGNAILSAAPLCRPALVRLDSGGEWFDGVRGERRAGGRVAVLAQIELSSTAVTFASVHLESHGDPTQRARQLAVLIAAIDGYAPGSPAVIGGDLNTFSLALSDLGDREGVAAALRADPERWSRPERHEPLFRTAEAAGFEWHACNVIGEPTHRHPTATGSARGSLKLDWLLCRGLRGGSPRVLAAVDEASGRALSDHEAVEATFRTAGTGPISASPRPGRP
jgi:endonuclease/exonuclease/phosphatase family metal-dependent hydrolase